MSGGCGYHNTSLHFKNLSSEIVSLSSCRQEQRRFADRLLMTTKRGLLRYVSSDEEILLFVCRNTVYKVM